MPRRPVATKKKTSELSRGSGGVDSDLRADVSQPGKPERQRHAGKRPLVKAPQVVQTASALADEHTADEPPRKDPNAERDSLSGFVGKIRPSLADGLEDIGERQH